MIGPNSRYVGAVIETAVGPKDDTRQVMQVRFPKSRRVMYTYYRVVGGDRIDTIAHDFYGNGQLWWMIADANPEIMDWLDLPPGEVIRVPNA